MTAVDIRVGQNSEWIWIGYVSQEAALEFEWQDEELNELQIKRKLNTGNNKLNSILPPWATKVYKVYIWGQ